MYCNIRIELALDPVDIYGNKDKSDYFLQKTRSIYEGICYKKMFIVKVLSIEWESEIEIIDFNLDACGKVRLILKVEYLQYSTYDIIVGCRVNKVEQIGTLMCSNDNVNVRVHPRNPIYAEKRLIPAIVMNVFYSINSKKISARAVDFSPIKYPVLEFAWDEYSERKMASLEETESLEAELAGLDQNLRGRFDSLMSYNKVAASAGSIKKFNPKPGYIVILTMLKSTDDSYYLTPGKSKDYPKCSFNELHEMVVKNYNKSMRNMITLLRYYDKEKYDQDKDIWDMYVSNKNKTVYE